MTKYKVIYPPDGHAYGFPRLMPEHINPKTPAFNEFLKTNGYPSHKIPIANDFTEMWSLDSDERKHRL